MSKFISFYAGWCETGALTVLCFITFLMLLPITLPIFLVGIGGYVINWWLNKLFGLPMIIVFSESKRSAQ